MAHDTLPIDSELRPAAEATRARIIARLLDSRPPAVTTRTSTMVLRRAEGSVHLFERLRGPARAGSAPGEWFAVQHRNGPVVTSDGTIYRSSDELIADLAWRRSAETVG